MFNENLKSIRKQKGFTQEDLAIKVNVVRQTVSKWEKGLSVPDAVTLQRIAEVLEVTVGELLGAEVKEEDRNELAEQLARINEQLAIRNRRWSRFWKVLVRVLLIVLVLWILIVVGGIISFKALTFQQMEPVEVEEIQYEEE